MTQLNIKNIFQVLIKRKIMKHSHYYNIRENHTTGYKHFLMEIITLNY